MPQSVSSSLVPLIDIRDIDLYREGECILHNFSLTIPQGCRYVILGPNGSGKSSLIMLLIRALYPAYKRGSWVKILGRSRWRVEDLQKRMGIISHDLHKEYPETASGIEVVLSGFFQSQGIYPHQNIEPLMMGKAEAVMENLGIIQLRDKPFSQMSTGEQRRCLLARAWVDDPDCLVLDEPTHGMDLKSTWQYLSLLRKWVRMGKSLILVTHHINEIIPEVDTVVLMQAGRVFSQGPKKQVLTEEGLSQIYGLSLRVHVEEGYYFVFSP